MTNLRTYEGRFVNQETTRPDNLSVQQEVIIRITDTESNDPTAYYNAKFRTLQNPDGSYRVFVQWDDLLAATTGVYFSYDNGGWVDLLLATTYHAGQGVVTLPAGDWSLFSFYVTFESGSPQRYLFPEGEVVSLEMGETPCKISVIDNAEDKFTTIRSKQAELQIYSSDSIDISLFAEGGDNRFTVDISLLDVASSSASERPIFIGFLSISDLSQEFLPDPNVITLTATDGLGFLNDAPLTTFDGVNPQNEHSLMDYLAWSLNKSGNTLDIYVIMNIRERFATPLISDDSGDGHFYKHESVDAKTFEEEIGVSENSYSVVEKILKLNATLSQHSGDWWILGVDEIEHGRDYYITRFNWKGEFIENLYQQHEKSLGVDLPLAWMNDDTEVSLQRNYRQVNLKYSFQPPLEIPCNIDFDRGEGPDITGVANETIDYTLGCWDFLREGSPSTGANLDQSPSVGAYGLLRKRYEYGYEKERYLVTKIASGFRHYFKSEGIPVQAGNKITIGFSHRLQNDESITNIDIAHMRLVGDDGFFYDWDYDAPSGVSSWVQKTAADTVFSNNWREDMSGLDNTEWKAISATSQPFPVAGKLYIRLLNNTSYEVWFSALSVENLFFTNGSFQKYTSQVHTVTDETAKTKATLNEEVFISDSPQRLFKGALLKVGGTDYVLANQFYNAAVFPNADFPDESYTKPYGEMQSFIVWNQYNRVLRKFEGTIDGLQSDSSIPDLMHKYKLTDINPNTTNGGEQIRYFMLLHNEIDLHLCEWDAFFIEVVNSFVYKQYSGHTFKYLTG